MFISLFILPEIFSQTVLHAFPYLFCNTFRFFLIHANVFSNSQHILGINTLDSSGSEKGLMEKPSDNHSDHRQKPRSALMKRYCPDFSAMIHYIYFFIFLHSVSPQ